MTVPPAGRHGGDGARVARALGLDPDDVLDLSASLNPFAPDVAALAARHLSSLRRYPDVDRAEALLGEGLGLPEGDRERLVLTAGGSQAIALVAQHTEVGWVEEPEFALYRRHLPRLDPAAPRWRSDPHNPSGRLVDDEPGDEPADEPGGEPGGPGAAGEPAGGSEGPGVPGVWDEAFLPLSAGIWTRGRPGWALGSLTKAFACPGLRLGFAIAPTPDDAAALRRLRPEWAVDGLACALLPELLERADPPGWTARIAAAREELIALLARHGLAADRTSSAPWVLVPRSGDLRERLAPHGVVVRRCTSFGMCDHSRIAVPGEAGMEQLDRALANACRGRERAGR